MVLAVEANPVQAIARKIGSAAVIKNYPSSSSSGPALPPYAVAGRVGGALTGLGTMNVTDPANRPRSRVMGADLSRSRRTRFMPASPDAHAHDIQ